MVSSAGGGRHDETTWDILLLLVMLLVSGIHSHTTEGLSSGLACVCLPVCISLVAPSIHGGKEGPRYTHARARRSDPADLDTGRDQQRVCGVRGRQHDLGIQRLSCHQLASVGEWGKRPMVGVFARDEADGNRHRRAGRFFFFLAF